MNTKQVEIQKVDPERIQGEVKLIHMQKHFFFFFLKLLKFAREQSADNAR